MQLKAKQAAVGTNKMMTHGLERQAMQAVEKGTGVDTREGQACWQNK